MRDNIKEEIGCALPYGEDDRVDYIMDVITLVASLQLD